jgi:hypothetical protein
VITRSLVTMGDRHLTILADDDPGTVVASGSADFNYGPSEYGTYNPGGADGESGDNGMVLAAIAAGAALLLIAAAA